MTVDVARLEALAARGRALVRQPQAAAGDWYRITATADRAEVLIYGVIGDAEDGMDAASFVRAVRDITAPVIDLHVNSPGGLVFDGIAIYAALKNHPAAVQVTVDSLAASAASFIAMAGDEIVMEKPARFMIHDAGGLAIGTAETMREMAAVLDETSDTIAGLYADRAGGTTAGWRAAMRAETWYSAEAAVQAGLADRVNEPPTKGGPTATDARSQMIRARARARSR